MSKRPKAEVRPHNGAPALFINGQPHSAFSYMTYGPRKKYFEQFAKAGVSLYSFPANADSLNEWGMAEVWKGLDDFDYSGESGLFDLILSAAPEAYIFPRVHSVGPQWWIKEHPEEAVYGIGRGGQREILEWQGLNFFSWASEKGLEKSKEAIRCYIEFVRSSPYDKHVIGYQICSWAVGEWMAWAFDISRPMLDRFSAYLEKKYRSVDGLRKAWDNPDATFDLTDLPGGMAPPSDSAQSFYELPKQQPMVDYWESYAEVVSDALLALTTTAKEACNNESVIGVFFGYLVQFGSSANYHGHTALRRVLESPSVDFFSSPTCYHRRSLTNGYSYFMSLPESVKLHGKMWWDENDYRTFLTTNIGRVTGEEIDAWTEERRRRHYDNQYRKYDRIHGATETREQSIAHQWRQAGHVLSRASGMWWFDMGGGWFDDAQFMKAIARMNEVAERALDVDRRDTAEIAVVVDAQTIRYQSVAATSGGALIIQQVPLLGRIGAPVSFYLLDDVAKAPDHKIWIFLNAFAPSDADIAAIRNKVMRNGQVALWLYAPGLLEENGRPDIARASALTGITLALQDVPSPFSVAVTQAAHPITRGLFETVYGVTGAEGGDIRQQIWLGREVNSDAGWRERYKRMCVRPTVYSSDPEAKVLGYLEGMPQPGLVVKEQPGWTSVFSSAGPVPGKLVRNIARYAGAHVYLDTDDVVYANQSFLAIATNAGGPRTVRLPRSCDVVNVATDEVVARGVAEFQADLPPADTQLYFLGKAGDWGK